MRHVLSVSDWSKDDIHWILDRASEWKKSATCSATVKRRPQAVLILERPSLRTRMAYEGAFHLLHGVLTVFEGGVGTSDSVGDVSRVLSEMLDLAIIRTRNHEKLEQIAATATIPVINALSDREHPVEVLADALVMREQFTQPQGRRIAFVGDGGNVCASLLLLAPLLGMSASVACPEGYFPDQAILERSRESARLHGTELMVTADVIDAVSDAAVVYTDGWPTFDSQDVQEGVFGSFRVTEQLMKRAAPDAIFLHCLPATRGAEVTDGVLDSAQSFAFRRLKNLVFTSAAMIEWALGGDML